MRQLKRSALSALVMLVAAFGLFVAPASADTWGGSGSSVWSGSSSNSSSTYVDGYQRSNGTYVSPHYRTTPNSSVYDNYSYRGNYNPYTGRTGTRSYSDWGD